MVGSKKVERNDVTINVLTGRLYSIVVGIVHFACHAEVTDFHSVVTGHHAITCGYVSAGEGEGGVGRNKATHRQNVKNTYFRQGIFGFMGRKHVIGQYETSPANVVVFVMSDHANTLGKT